jgi:ankyrin repeat protein
MGCTALQRAAAEGHLDVVKQLIKNGADVNRQDNVVSNCHTNTDNKNHIEVQICLLACTAV